MRHERSEREPSQQPEGGPYLQAAFFCERLLEEADGVLSAIRIVDTVTLQGGSPSDAETATVNLTLLIAFKAGQARGTFDLVVEMEEPGRSPSDAPVRHTQTILFDGADHGGVTVIMPLALVVDQESVPWFRASLDERLVTRLPLRVVSNRAP